MSDTDELQENYLKNEPQGKTQIYSARCWGFKMQAILFISTWIINIHHFE